MEFEIRMKCRVRRNLNMANLTILNTNKEYYCYNHKKIGIINIFNLKYSFYIKLFKTLFYF